MDSMNQNELIVQGMILRSTPQGDYDKRLVILTKERGKITVFARGARRAKNVLTGKTNPFAFGTFHLGTGSSAYYLRNAEITNYFMEMGMDYERSCYGFYFLEFAEYYGREGVEELQMLKLLYQSMRALLNESIPNRLVRYIFELKAMVINGEYPEVFQCMKCRKTVEDGYFSVNKAGVVCHSCKEAVHDGIYIDASVLYTFQYIITAEIEKLYTFVVKEEVFRKIKEIMNLYTRRYIDYEFRSLALLEENFGFHS